MKILECKLIQRKLICITLGILFGLLCVHLANSSSEESLWGTTVMWAILYNRLLIGFVVLIIGAFNWHAIFNFRYWPSLRGFTIGILVSIDMAIGSLMTPDKSPEELKMIFWATILVGGVYGLIIDVIATRITGDGKELLQGWTK